MRRQLAVIGIIAVLLSLAACSGTSSKDKQPVTLTFWTTTPSPETAFFQERINAFEKEHPNIKVNIAMHEFPFATNEFKTAVLGDQEVDIFRADNTWIPEYANLNIIYPLNTLGPRADSSGFVSSALDAATYQGNIYGFPSVMEVPALLYNKRILREAGFTRPPQTMDELLKMAKALTGKERYGLYVTEDSYFSLPYLWAFGGDMISDQGHIQIASVRSKQAFEFMLKLRREGVTQPYDNFNNWHYTMMNDFTEGRSAMMINGPWAIHDVLKGKEFQNPDNIGIAPIPRGPGGQGSPIGGHSLVINKYSRHPKESYELIRYLTSTETEILQSERFKTLPTQQAAYTDPRLASDLLVQGFRAQLDVAKTQPKIPLSSKLYMDFTPNLNAMLFGKESVDEGVRKIESSWQNLLEMQ
ncbi:extracellular solute-binding protein [Paenibacillus sp. YPG26]|uniref:extracellular solute-binding protein n=1 Tax=Paenibacillus sp. YPG26 TaxID=2878915 RepID=UPI00204239A5|nr:extracellular solute-binding protein [Paenibacillus sp. YPG26]USB33101.1 extracellular solute-binding protein [Paenibacillus sp. YPG26]